MSYVVIVEDNFHFMDESERHCLGEFAEAEVAVAHCRRSIDDYLVSAHKPGMPASELYKSYTMFGDDFFIHCVDVPKVAFSAWDYAKARCDVLCASKAPDPL